jgi:hypothetical protein
MKAIYIISDKNDTAVEFSVPLEVAGYECGISDIGGELKENIDTTVYLCSDICEESFVGNVKLPVLLKLKRNRKGVVLDNVDHMIWLNLNRPSISRIRFYICDVKGNVLSEGKNKWYCTLLLQKRHVESTF